MNIGVLMIPLILWPFLRRCSLEVSTISQKYEFNRSVSLDSQSTCLTIILTLLSQITVSFHSLALAIQAMSARNGWQPLISIVSFSWGRLASLADALLEERLRDEPKECLQGRVAEGKTGHPLWGTRVRVKWSPLLPLFYHRTGCFRHCWSKQYAVRINLVYGLARPSLLEAKASDRFMSSAPIGDSVIIVPRPWHDEHDMFLIS